MIDIDEIILQLTNNAEAIRSLVQAFSSEHAQWKPNSESWSLKEVMEHVYNEEMADFRKHLKDMLHDPPRSWAEFRREDYIPVKDHRQALEGFLVERKASITWLRALESPVWEVTSQMRFGPTREVMLLRAGDVLTSWVAHDFLHMRQMIELLYSWNEKQASPYSVQYAGGW